MPHKFRDDDQRIRTILPHGMAFVRIVMGCLVLVAVVRTGLHARQELVTSGFDWTEVDWRWLCGAGVLYAASQIPLALYWRRILAALDVRIRFGTALRGFVAGQLGKYVPGKLMVVIIRSSLLQLPVSQLPQAASSVFVETFTYMAVGAFLAGLGGLVFFRREWVLQLVSLGVMALMIVLTNPALIKRLMCSLRARTTDSDAEPDDWGVSYRLIGIGWAASLTGWTLSTASLCATLQAIPITDPGGFRWQWDTPLRLGTSLAAAVVLGFASMLPGGLGAREFVLDRLLAPMLGEYRALTVTVLLRAVWLLTEVVASSILYLGSGKATPKSNTR